MPYRAIWELMDLPEVAEEAELNHELRFVELNYSI